MSIKSNNALQSSARGRILSLLRQGSQTAGQIANELGLSLSRVRSVMVDLEEEGLAQHVSLRLGTRKPHHSYSLTPAGDQLFCRGYVPVLAVLLDTLKDRLVAPDLLLMLKESGTRLAGTHSTAPSGQNLRERAASAIPLFEQLGGFVTLQEQTGTLALESTFCPLASVVNQHPEVCRILESLLSSIIKAPVQESCTRGQYPRCRFEIRAS